MLSSTSHMVQQQDREEPKQEPFLMDHRELEAREEASFKLNVKDRLAMHFGNGSRCEGPGSRSRNGCRKTTSCSDVRFTLNLMSLHDVVFYVPHGATAHGRRGTDASAQL